MPGGEQSFAAYCFNGGSADVADVRTSDNLLPNRVTSFFPSRQSSFEIKEVLVSQRMHQNNSFSRSVAVNPSTIDYDFLVRAGRLLKLSDKIVVANIEIQSARYVPMFE